MEPGSLDARLTRLERRSRLLAAGWIGTVVLLLGAWIAPTEVEDLVQARRIQVVDATGRLMIDLRHDSLQTGMFIRDGEGAVRVGVAQFGHGGGGVALHGPGSRGGAVLFLKTDASLTFYDPDGKVLSRITAPYAPQEGR